MLTKWKRSECRTYILKLFLDLKCYVKIEEFFDSFLEPVQQVARRNERGAIAARKYLRARLAPVWQNKGVPHCAVIISIT